EDGIRDFHVTGVQTCALPISVYRCLQRISILRKGLYTLINNENIDEDIYFALGSYNANKKDTHNSFKEDGKVVYRKMDTDGKDKIGTASCRERVKIMVGDVTL